MTFMNEAIKQLLRQLPDVDTLLQRPAFQQLEKPRHIVRDAIRAVLDDRRRAILEGLWNEPFSMELFEQAVAAFIQGADKGHLRRVINGTGTVLHTNLGRAVLSPDIAGQIAELVGHYTNLEYDLALGKRGLRDDHVRELLCQLTGAEDALVVNNNAAAVLLVLASLMPGKEVVVSRGELVEIGGSFRIPDVIEQSGCTIREVGTTNKTHLADYERAIREDTGALMKVHTSNYRIIGFTESVAAADLVRLAHAQNLPCINDLGSGLFIDLESLGLPHEPTVREVIEAGCDVVTFSGDKLLGGPQAGIIVGKASYIERMRRHPLLRALRIDKMTLAGLEGTLRIYRDGEAVQKIPTLAALVQPSDLCHKRGKLLAAALSEAGLPLEISLVEVDDAVGGGAFPGVVLSGWGVAVRPTSGTVTALEESLRKGDIPVLARIRHDALILSVRTLGDEEFSDIVRAMKSVLQS